MVTSDAVFRLGQVFADRPIPAGVEVLNLLAPIGTLTVARALPRGVTRGSALLIPGFTGCKEDYFPLLPLLAERGYAAYAYSQRGQADSAGPRDDSTSSYRIQDFATDAVFVQHALGGPVHLVGHSFGGVIAQAAAIREPMGFQDVTLLCSGPHGWADRDADIPALLAGHTCGLPMWERENPGAGSLDPETLTAEQRYRRAQFAATSAGNLLGANRILADPTDRTDDLADTGLPVLVAHGEFDDAWPQEWQRGMAERLAERGVAVRYSVIARAAHCPNEEEPEATAELLAEFWAFTTTG